MAGTWMNILSTMQLRAGHYAGFTVDPNRLNRARLSDRINASVCPPLIYNDNSWDWSSRTTAIIQAADTRTSTERAEDKKDERAKNAAIIGTILMAVGSILVGYTYYNWDSQRSALNKTEEAQSLFYKERSSDLYLLFQEKTADLGLLLNAVEALDRHRLIKANKLLCLATLFTTGATMMAVGGFSTTMVLITAGQVTTVASAAIAAGVMMYHWFADEDLKLQAREVTRQLGQLIDHLATTEEALYSNLTEEEDPPPTYGYWTNTSPPPYESLFLPGHRRPTYAPPI